MFVAPISSSVSFSKWQIKSFFVLLCAIYSSNCFSQIEKGKWLIGGSGSFSYAQAAATNRTYKVLTLDFAPAAGYFFFNRFAGGLRPTIGIQTNRSTPDHKNRTTSFTINPFLRYYFLAENRKVNLFADAGYGYFFSKYTQFDGVYDETYHSSTLSFKAGPSIFLNEHTALEITLGYNYSTRGPIDTFKTNTIQLGIGLQFHLGKRNS
jgi:hypothetical protein